MHAQENSFTQWADLPLYGIPKAYKQLVSDLATGDNFHIVCECSYWTQVWFEHAGIECWPIAYSTRWLDSLRHTDGQQKKNCPKWKQFYPSLLVY